MSNAEHERVVGWRLARLVAGSRLYEELGDLERAECDELLARARGGDANGAAREPEGVPCRLGRCNYRADCERTQYCQSAVMHADAYRSFIGRDLIPTLTRVLESVPAAPEADPLGPALHALLQRAKRTV